MASVQERRKLFVKRDSVAEFASAMPVDKLREMKELFNSMDTDKDGYLTEPELASLFAELNVKCTSEEVSKLVATLDKDGDGKITFKEFLEGMKWIKKSSALSGGARQRTAAAPKKPVADPSNIETPADVIASTRAKGYHNRSRSIINFVQSLDETQIARIKELFRMCDIDGDGVITKSELYSLTKQLGMDVSKHEFELLFANLDLDGDGRVEFDEFLTGMRWLKHGINFSGSSQQQKPSSTTQSTPPSKTDKLESEEEDDDDEILKERISELEERNKILFTYVKQTVAKALETSKAHLKNGEIIPANAILSILDLEFLVDMEDFIGIVMDKKQASLYKKMKQFIKDNLPKQQ